MIAVSFLIGSEAGRRLATCWGGPREDGGKVFHKPPFSHL